MIWEFLLIFVLGLIQGSFLTSYTYRSPRGKGVIFGRSTCPKCGEKIAWHDNIPLFSFIFLKGRCRSCKKKISLRYPLIEFFTGVFFVITYMLFRNCYLGLERIYLPKEGVFCQWESLLSFWSLPYFLIITTILIAIFVIDWEERQIPDFPVFLLMGLSFFAHILASNDKLYSFLTSGFSAGSFLLILNLITKGKGMGLGDAKLVIPIGFILGFPNVFFFLAISFIIGALLGIILILLGKASFRKEIAFGPFLVLSFWIVLIFGGRIPSPL